MINYTVKYPIFNINNEFLIATSINSYEKLEIAVKLGCKMFTGDFLKNIEDVYNPLMESFSTTIYKIEYNSIT